MSTTDDRKKKVYVLSRIDSYDHGEILGVYATAQAAQAAAESSEPGRFDWQPIDDGLYASYGTFSGPVYSYSVDPFEVTS